MILRALVRRDRVGRILFFLFCRSGRAGRLGGGAGSGLVTFDEWGDFFFFQCDSVVFEDAGYEVGGS